MTKKREPTTTGMNNQPAVKRKRATKATEAGEPTKRGTAAGLRAGAGTAKKAKARTSNTGKLSQKELTKRGGPGRAGESSAQKGKGTARKKTAGRGRGAKARAGS
jgi:hypothetical protein